MNGKKPKRLIAILLSSIMLLGILPGSSGVWAKAVDESNSPPVNEYTVMIIAGAHMTKTQDSGAEKQVSSGSPITNVVYQADAGFYFPDDYSTSLAGIRVTRVSYTQITISGTPEQEDISIELIDAKAKETQTNPAGLGDGTEKITGTTAAMEYAASPDAKSWSVCGDGETAVTAGTWYVRYKETATKSASSVTEVIVSAASYSITATPEKIDFITKNEGYTQPDAQTVTVKNTGNSAIKLNQPKSSETTSFDVDTLSKTTLMPEETATFTIRPKADLKANSYNETISVGTDKDTHAEVNVSFKVNAAFTAAISPGASCIIKGENQTLKAIPKGGSGKYTYLWYEGSSATEFSKEPEVRVSPAETTTYKLVVNDTIENKEAKVTVTVTPKSPEAPEIIRGKTQTWTKGSKSGLSFTSNADFNEFLSVSIDGKKIAEDNYTVKSGSTIVTLKTKYLETLSAGKHTLSIISENGSAETTFTILNSKAQPDTATKTNNKKVISKSPQTGDTGSLVLWFSIILLSVSGVVGIIIINKRKKNAGK